MKFYTRDGIFQTFFDKRSRLIKDLEEGKLSKKEFLEGNYNLVRRSNIRPFLRIDNYEMGMYNYQYYNVLAKYYKMLAKESRQMGRSNKIYQEYWNKGNNYYNEKDKATLSLLEYLDYKNIEAYFIKMESNYLNGKLYEIVLLDYKEAIFHSKCKKILKKLKEKKVFTDKKKQSKIKDYINETY